MTPSRKYLYPILICLLCCFGAIGVQALPTCQRLVKTYKTIRTKNKVSPLVAARWAVWGKAHPDYKPAGNRPRYKYTHKEIVDKVDFACATPPPIIDTEVALEPLPPIDDEFAEEPLNGPPVLYHTPDVVTVANNNMPVLPFIPPYSSVIPPIEVAPVPEPSSLLLIGTGAVMLMLARRRLLRVPARVTIG